MIIYIIGLRKRDSEGFNLLLNTCTTDITRLWEIIESVEIYNELRRNKDLVIFKCNMHTESIIVVTDPIEG